MIEQRLHVGRGRQRQRLLIRRRLLQSRLPGEQPGLRGGPKTLNLGMAKSGTSKLVMFGKFISYSGRPPPESGKSTLRLSLAMPLRIGSLPVKSAARLGVHTEDAE